MSFRIRAFLALLLLVPAEFAYAQTFQGNLDSANGGICTVSGWARDPQTTDPIQVRIYRDGNATSGTLVTTFVASLTRNDLPYTDKNHGFNQSLAGIPGLADGRDHTIFAYAVNSSGASGNISGNGRVMRCTISAVIATAPRLTLVSGEAMQLDAVAIDFLGIARPNDTFNFTSTNSNVISVGASGVVTAKNPGVANVTANVQGTTSNSPAVTLQVIPSRIAIAGDTSDMRVGESRQFTAVALDINSVPISGVTFTWRVTGGNGNQTNAATIDSTGWLTTNGIGLLTIRAQIVYSGQSAAHLSIFEATVQATVKAGSGFRLTRVLANSVIDRSLALRPAYNSEPAINDVGQIAFTANLEGLGNALMLYDNGSFVTLASAGTPGPLGGYIWHFEGPPSINNSGDVLVRVGTSSGWGLLRASKSSGLSFFLENGVAEGFARMNYFRPGRSSLNDQGDMLFLGDYLPIGGTAYQTGLFLLNDTSFRVVWSASDPLPGFPANYTFDNFMFCVDRNGVAYFRVTNGGQSAIYRADGLSAPVRIAASGMSLGSAVFGGAPLQSVNSLAVSPNGTMIFHVAGSAAGQIGMVRIRSGQSNLEYLGHTTINQVLSINDSGEALYVGNPGLAPFGGLYMWLNGTAFSQVLRFGNPAAGSGPNTLEGGELPNGARHGKVTSAGGIYASLNSPQNALLMVRADGTVRTLWKSGTMVANPRASLSFQGVVPGALTGPVHVFGGGGNASVLEVGASSARAVWVPGDQPAGLTGTTIGLAAKNPSGDLYLAVGDGIARFRNGTAEAVLRFPVTDRSNVIVRGSASGSWYDGANWLAANSAGSFVFNARTDTESRVELFTQGGLTPIAILGVSISTPSPGGGRFTGLIGGPARQNAVLIDERGRVMMNATVASGPGGLFLFENGQWRSAALIGVTSIGGSLVSGVRSMRVAGETFYAVFDLANGLDTMIAQYDGQNWTPLIRRYISLPDGTSLNFLSSGFAANRKGDIVFGAFANAFKMILRTADGVNHLVYSEMALTDDGDRFANQNFEYDIRDNGQIYFTGIDSTDRSVVYKVSPTLGAPTVSFSIPDRGGTSTISSGTPASVGVGYGKIQASAGSNTPSGLAIFGFRQNNILVTEAGVPASPAIKSGRTYAEVGSGVNTGLAMVNPNGRDALVAFYFTDLNGNAFGNGTMTIPAEGKITAFLDQAPFNGGSSLKGSFTFSSSEPISVVALRGLTNERGEFLITTLPVTDLSVPAVSSTVVFPDFADGGGWATQVLLVNPGDTVLTGSVQFWDQAGALTAVAVNGQSSSSFQYSIPARAALKLQTAGSASAAVTGSVRVIPSGTTAAPAGLAVFSLRTAGVTVTEVGVLAQSPGNAFRLYAETAGAFGDVGSIQSGLAVTNNSAVATAVTLELTKLDGTSTGLTGTLSLPANGQVATFLNQIQGFATLQAPFQGVLRVSSAASIAVVGLRARYNERGDFLASSTPPINESSASSSAPVYFPQIADGGGYTTQFILFSGQGQSSGAMELFSESGGVLNLTLR